MEVLQHHRGDITEALSPTWAKSVNRLIYYKQYSLYFTAYRGTIQLKWPGVFLFMYLFIWEETGGTLGHYQLILLRGVFLWAEEIACFDLLCKSVPYISGRRLSVGEAACLFFSFVVKMCRIMLQLVQFLRCLAQPGEVSWVIFCLCLADFIYCYSVTSLPDSCLLRHDRACVISRPQGHQIKPHALQPAAITHVLDGTKPKHPKPAAAQNTTCKVQSTHRGHWSEYVDTIFQLCIASSWVSIVSHTAACQRR